MQKQYYIVRIKPVDEYANKHEFHVKDFDELVEKIKLEEGEVTLIERMW